MCPLCNTRGQRGHGPLGTDSGFWPRRTRQASSPGRTRPWHARPRVQPTRLAPAPPRPGGQPASRSRATRGGGGHLPGGHRHWKRLTLSTHCPLFTQGLLWHSSTSSSQCTPLKPARTDHTAAQRQRDARARDRAPRAAKTSTSSVCTTPKRTRPRWTTGAVGPDGDTLGQPCHCEGGRGHLRRPW